MGAGGYVLGRGGEGCIEELKTSWKGAEGEGTWRVGAER